MLTILTFLVYEFATQALFSKTFSHEYFRRKHRKIIVFSLHYSLLRANTNRLYLPPSPGAPPKKTFGRCLLFTRDRILLMIEICFSESPLPELICFWKLSKSDRSFLYNHAFFFRRFFSFRLTILLGFLARFFFDTELECCLVFFVSFL